MDIDGSDAFDRVLDKLLDAHNNAEGQRALRSEAETNLRTAVNKIDELRGEIAHVKSFSATNATILKELWESSRAYVDAIDSGAIQISEQRRRLLDALAASQTLCGVDVSF